MVINSTNINKTITSHLNWTQVCVNKHPRCRTKYIIYLLIILCKRNFFSCTAKKVTNWPLRCKNWCLLFVHGEFILHLILMFFFNEFLSKIPFRKCILLLCNYGCIIIFGLRNWNSYFQHFLWNHQPKIIKLG